MFFKMISVGEIVFPIFFIIGLGYFLVKVGIINNKATQSLSKFVFYVALPVLLFLSISKSDNIIENTNWKLIIFANLFIIAFFIVLAIFIKFLKITPKAKGVLLQASYRSNTAFVGLPICLNAFGEDVFFQSVIFFSFLIPVFNFFAVIALTLPQHKTINKKMIKSFVIGISKNPLIISISLGLIFSLLNITIPQVIKRTLLPISKTALPLALIVVGCSLNLKNIGFRIKTTSIIVIIKLLILPATAYLLLNAIGFHTTNRNIAVIMFGCPTAVSSYIMAREMNGDIELAGDAVMLTTLVSVISLPLWLLTLI